jgi:hypothetical protein
VNVSPRKDRPIDQVLARADEFGVQRPDEPPWLQSEVRSVEHASTGDVVRVPLGVADRANVHGLTHRERELPENPDDCTRQSWGLPAA